MSGVYWVTYGALWFLVAALTVLVILLYRQFGLMYMRGGRRLDLAGLDIGATAPELVLVTPDDGPRAFTWRAAVGLHGRFDGSAVLFALPGCAICQSIAPDANGLAAAWPSIEFVWIDRELPQPPEEAQADFLAGWRIGLSEDESAFKDFDVAGVPFFYVIGRDGIIAAKKLVNAVEDIQRLVKSVYGPELAEKAEIGHALGGYDD